MPSNTEIEKDPEVKKAERAVDHSIDQLEMNMNQLTEKLDATLTPKPWLWGTLGAAAVGLFIYRKYRKRGDV